VTNQEVIELLLKVKGKVEVTDLRGEIERLTDQLRRQYEAMDILDRADIKNNQSVKDKIAQIKALTRELQAQDAAAEKVGKSAANMGRAGIEFSRFTQDAVAGFGANGLAGAVNATANNVEGLLLSLGMGTGLVGTLALVAGMAPLVIGALKSMFTGEPVQSFTDHLDELKAKLKALEDQPIKLLADTQEIERLKKEIEATTKAKQALDALLGRQTETERKSGQLVDAAIVETPGGREALAAAKARAGDEAAANDPAVQTARAILDQARQAAAKTRTEPGGGSPQELEARRLRVMAAEQAAQAAETGVAAAEKRARDAAQLKLGAELEAARSGTGLAQVEAQRELARRLEAEGPAGAAAAQGVGQADPAAVRRRAGAEADTEKAQAAREQERKFGQWMMGEFEGELGAWDATADATTKAQTQAKREADRAAKEQKAANELEAARFGRENPLAGPQMQEQLRRQGNTPEAQEAARRRLQEQGLSEGGAGQFVGQQAGELGENFAAAMSVTRDLNAANVQIQGEIARKIEQIIQQLDPIARQQRQVQDQLDRAGYSMQRMGRP
jgi:hypothetical protein